MEIIPITPADNQSLAEIAAIYVESWREAYHNLLPPEYLDSLDPSHWEAVLADPARTVWAAREGGRFVATASTGPARDEALAGWGEVVSLYVLPDSHRRGIGAALLDAAVRGLREQGLRDLYLWVLRENTRARRFYESHGFSATSHILELDIGGRRLAEIRYIRRFPAPAEREALP